jgi:hypothetical protein
LIEIHGKNIGVEVDGPSHFINKQPNGPIDKIPLVSVPYWEWDKFGKDRDKETRVFERFVCLFMRAVMAIL